MIEHKTIFLSGSSRDNYIYEHSKNEKFKCLNIRPIPMKCFNYFQKIFLLLWSLVGRAYCSFGGSHDHSHGHDHSDDPHSGHFCWDISQWGEIFYKEIEIPCSDTNFEMKCRDVPKTVI